MCLSVAAVARLVTPAGGNWSGYNYRVIHSCGLQHRCDEHSSTCKAAEGSLNIVAETSDHRQAGGNGGGPPQYSFFLRIVQSVNVCIGGGACVCVCVYI